MELHFSDTVKRLRKERKFTQEQLAEALGVTTGAVYKWENGLAIQLEKYDKALGIVQWAYNAAKGLRDTTVITFLDKTDAVFLTMMADISERSGDTPSAYSYLQEALATARRFDAAPEYRSSVGMNFYHSSPTSISIDDLGDTAYLAVQNYIIKDACHSTQSIWKELTNETN